MRNKTLSFLGAGIAVALLAASCEDETSQIGSTLDQGEVTILVDSTFTVKGHSVEFENFDPRNEISLLGRIAVPEYGDLSCTFMSQMLSASQLDVPDSIDVSRVDSMKLVLKVPRGQLVGDSLAPQQAKVYRLSKPLQADAAGKYDPADYYSADNLLGSRSFTLSALSQNDSLFTHSKYIDIPINISTDFARKIFTDYRTDPSAFQWPSTFAKYFPGIYVESSFGSGCLANVTKAQMVMYYYYLKTFTVPVDSVTTTTEVRHMKDSVTVFATAPEVISVNNISLTPSEAIKARIAAGEEIITTPAGYNLRLTFPLLDIIDRYETNINAMTVVDNLSFSIPASKIENDFEIGVPPNLLMVKTSKLQEFFDNNLAPDNLDAFTAAYNSNDGSYTFNSMRAYFNYAIQHPDEITEDYYDFTLVPVSLVTQEKYVSYNQKETVVIGANPYVARPTMARIHLDRAKIRFTYSRQEIY